MVEVSSEQYVVGYQYYFWLSDRRSPLLSYSNLCEILGNTFLNSDKLDRPSKDLLDYAFWETNWTESRTGYVCRKRTPRWRLLVHVNDLFRRLTHHLLLTSFVVRIFPLQIFLFDPLFYGIPLNFLRLYKES